ncbi:MAG TPA: hydroxymethylbilane synthase [Solirubrobacterales bacterium]|nr:hydroxymethylbilane synthase [Solirubrobacterales bacterium]
MPLRLATRGSALALAQARQVAEMIGGAELVEVSSDGDPGDKARFVRGVEEALLEGAADIGVHSAKDLPVEMPDGLVLAGVPPRENPLDVWIGPGRRLGDVPAGITVGTASLRRASQLLAARPDLEVVEMHGNVDTRLRKQREGGAGAIVLAAAGLRRLGRHGEISFPLPAEVMTPAAGQGALALQTRSADDLARDAATRISAEAAVVSLTAERSVVGELDASCATPIGVAASIDGEDLVIDAFVGLADGSEWIRDRVVGDAAAPAALAAELAGRLASAGAVDLLRRAEEAAA